MNNSRLTVGKDFINRRKIPHRRKLKKDKTLKRFLPILSLVEEAILLETYDAFEEACKKANITYILWGGSLLGAYRHHGMIPWDDDIDVMILSADLDKVRSALSSVSRYQLFSPPNVQWKFYLERLEYVHGKPFKYPFIDIFFFQESSKGIMGLFPNMMSYVYAKDVIYPIQRRKVFENRFVPIPCNVDAVLKMYHVDMCEPMVVMHTSDEAMLPVQLPCEKIHNNFPFVFRKFTDSGIIVETLKRGNKTLSEVEFPSSCK